MKISARLLGERVGKDAREVNRKLAELGLLTGGPNAWQITDAGREYGEVKFKKTGNGRACVTGYEYIVWDESLAYKMGDPDGWRKFVNENRRAAGLPPVDW